MRSRTARISGRRALRGSVHFFLASGGYLADRFSKRSVTLWTKVFEIGVMLIAVLSWPNPFPWRCRILVCTPGALSGRRNMACFPNLLPAEKTSWGNGVPFELGTFLGIIAGSVCGAVMADSLEDGNFIGSDLVALRVAGLCSALGSPVCQPPTPAKKFNALSLITLVADES